MLKRKMLSIFFILALVVSAVGCAGTSEKKEVKIGVSFGVGEAPRWEKEKVFMEEQAEKKDIIMEFRLNKTDEPKTQKEDCKEMIDSGIDVLILTPRDVSDTKDIVQYAKEKKVKVLAYARGVADSQVDLYVGYDCYQIGGEMGRYLSEKVPEGDYIVLKGDEKDLNTTPLYEGGMKHLTPLAEGGDIQILLDEYVQGWSAEKAKEMVRSAVETNGNTVDAIFAPNDTLAGACREVLDELGVTAPVAITGMDADIPALQRIVSDRQDMTTYMDLQEMSEKAVDQASKMAKGEAVESNATFYNNDDAKSDAYLISGKLILKENVDRILIESGKVKKEDIYGN